MGDADLVTTPERPAPGHHLVEHDAERPQIGSRVHLVPVDLLRRHVRDRPQSGPRSREGEVTGLGQAEIQDLHGTIGQQHHVGRLEIAVHDPGLMRGAQPARELGGHVQRLRQREPALPGQPRLEGFPLVERHGVEEIAVRRLAGLEDRTEVGMVQGGRRARFLAEALEGGPIDVAGGQGNLERDRAPEPGVFGSIDHTHSAARDRLDDPEMGHGATDEVQRIGLWNLFTQDGIDPHQDRVGPRVGRQQLLDGALQLRIGDTDGAQPSYAAPRRRDRPSRRTRPGPRPIPDHWMAASWNLALQFEREPRTRRAQLPLDRRQRDAERLRRFLQREPAEIALFQNPGSALVDRLQSLERLVQLRDGVHLVVGEPGRVLEREAGLSPRPRLAALRARAWSTSRCRMTRDARPRKCPRSRRVTWESPPASDTPRAPARWCSGSRRARS